MDNELDIDDLDDYTDNTQDVSEDQSDYYGTYPRAKEKQDIYNWFWKVVKLGKLSERNKEQGFSDESLRLSKVGNLNTTEIGQPRVSVRDSLNLAMLGKIFGHKLFGDFWQSHSMITSATSMAKGGWFMDLSISQKKVRERKKELSPYLKKKWKLFGKKKEEE